jgi:hypothetical protein
MSNESGGMTKAKYYRPTPEETLEFLANPESWEGNPHSHDAILLGHFTPYELARITLGLSES